MQELRNYAILVMTYANKKTTFAVISAVNTSKKRPRITNSLIGDFATYIPKKFGGFSYLIRGGRESLAKLSGSRW
jgi:hypothetical protein